MPTRDFHWREYVLGLVTGLALPVAIYCWARILT